MNVQVAVLCDAATDYGGKLNILGTFDTVLARQMPATHPHCAVALRVVFGRSEEAKHKLRLDFIDADGRPVIPHVEFPFEVSLSADAIQSSRNFVVNIQNLKFEQPGHYAVTLAVDGRILANIPLHVKLAAANE